MTEAPRAGIDMREAGFGDDPYAEYARLRAEAAVHRLDDFDGHESWFLSRYEDCRQAQVDRRLSKRPPAAKMPGGKGPITPTVHNTDPPDHTRLRRLVNKAFTPRRIEERMRPRVQEIVDGLLDRMAASGGVRTAGGSGGEEDVVDLIPGLALPLPITAICELLGIPAEDRGRFLAWFTPESAPGARQGRWGEAVAYFSDLVDRRRPSVRLDLTEDEQPDLVSVLIAARDGDDALTGPEVVNTLTLLLIAGHETTVQLLASGMLALFQHPDQMRLLRERPELLPSAVEELCRYVSPQQRTPWFATEDIEVGGLTIPEGALVTLGIASANRDPEQFADPDRLDVTRTGAHQAFGHGIHFCLGAPLARQEARIAFGTLLGRFPDLSLACRPEELRWRPFNGFFRGLASLPVRLRAARPQEATIEGGSR